MADQDGRLNYTKMDVLITLSRADMMRSRRKIEKRRIVRTIFSTPQLDFPDNWGFIGDGNLYEVTHPESFDESGPGMGGSALGGAEMSNERSTELHPHSPGPAPLLVPEEEENDLLRAVAPFLRGGDSIQVPDQTPQAGASPVDESINASSSEDDSSSSSSSEVSVSEDESEVEVSSEVADSTPQFWGKWEEREKDLFLRAQSLKIREKIDEEYFNDIPRNLNEAAALGERAYQSHLDFEEFEVGMLEKRTELRDRLIDLFSNDNDPQVLLYRQENPDPTSRLKRDFLIFDEKISGRIETWDRFAPGFRERAQEHMDYFINYIKNQRLDSMTYLEFKREVFNKEVE